MNAIFRNLDMKQGILCWLLGLFVCALVPVQLSAEDTRGNAKPDPAENFEAGDAPATVKVGEHAFSTPFGYSKGANDERKYPLVVIGKWREGNVYFNVDVRKKHPSFYLIYDFTDEGKGAQLADLIDQAIAQGLRIDANRILYTGFSGGGSGSFKLVKGMASKGKYIAGLNRGAGQSESSLEESATGKTAIWLHQGLKDSALRVETQRKLYKNLKEHANNKGAVETFISDMLKVEPRISDTFKPETRANEKITDGMLPRNTWILTKNGVDVVRYSEYPTCGHDDWIAYLDPNMYEWIFGRTNAAAK